VADGNRQALAPLGATLLEDRASGAGAHAGAKSMGTFSTLVVRLVGALHDDISD
jgi:hypothetical protein